MESPKSVQVGDCVVFVDPKRIKHDALVTAVWGQEVYDQEPPALNLIFVSADEKETDSYGRQTKHESSVVHESYQKEAKANCWMQK